MPVWNWSTNNIPLEYYALGDNLSTQVPNPFYGQSQTFASQPTVELSHLLGLAPQYSQVSPGQATWGRSFSNFLNMQIQTRSFRGLTLLASYTFGRLSPIPPARTFNIMVLQAVACSRIHTI